ncbi:chloride channel protein [Aerosakkonemataceae cyanobacterium BLCC-F154]|uniref:Chloride channel protein n=1 Tax=Floridaenema fluviatile BLCC-F154 TaxID=3153640 RepID=A0ABV4YJH9_9CYAN
MRQLLRPTRRLAIIEASLIGLVAALASVLLKVSSGWLGGWRVSASYDSSPWIALPIIGFCFGFLAGVLVEKFAPEASGSGIPQVKAALAGFPISLSWRVALVKLLGSILALGSGMTVGRQGPTVQVGAALAAQMSKWVPTSPEHRKQLIACGAGAGLAAAFNAPLAGVLFVVEELLHDVSGFTLGTAILASFIGGVVSRLLGGGSLELTTELAASSSTFSFPEIPCFLFLGVLAGLFSALFCQGIFLGLRFWRYKLKLSLPWRIGIAGLISGLVIATLPIFFRDNAGLREFVLTGSANWSIATQVFLAHFVLTIIAFSSGTPGGLFAPSLILGSTLGYLVGLGTNHFLDLGTPTTYAFAGMGAFFSAVSKVPITAIVIVFEMTTDFNLVLPLMIAACTSFWVAEVLMPRSFYDRILQWNGIDLDKYKETPKEGLLEQLTAEDVMQRRVETLTSKMTLDEVVQAFSKSHHRGFPVVDNGKLLGIITQSDLAKIGQRLLDFNTTLDKIMTPQPISVEPNTSLADVLFLLNRYELSRLPVVEGRRLVGIITRADIIRAEADHLVGVQTGPQPEPTYIVYQTRSPSIGKGRLLVPLANPQTAQSLLQIAAAIARDRDYELDCLQVIIAPRHTTPSEAKVRTTKSRRLLRQAEITAKKWGVPIHTQIRVAHDPAQAILETIKTEHIDLIVMGWNPTPPTRGRIFGHVVDTVIRQAACEVIVVKLGHLTSVNGFLSFKNKAKLTQDQVTFNRWLLPMAGGPNAEEAIQLLPALCKLSDDCEVRITQVFSKSKSLPDTKGLEKAAKFLSNQINHPVITIPVCATSVSEAVIDIACKDQCDAIILGASRDGLLQQVIKGNIPEAIARGCDCTVILVRGV